MTRPLEGKVALVAGATRGAGRGIALALGDAGAIVYCTGRSSRADSGRAKSAGEPFDLARRPETIEETAEMVQARGGTAIALRVDHTDEAAVQALIERIARDHGRLDVLVNDIWGGEAQTEWGTPFWQLSAEKGFALFDRVMRTHFLTSRYALPCMLERGGGLVVEVTDGDFFGYRGALFYDLAKILPIRLAFALWAELESNAHEHVTAVALTPGFLRSEAMLELMGVTEANWQDGVASDRHFAQSETPLYVGRAVAALAADPNVHAKSGRVLSSWGLAREYGFTDADGRRPDWGAHFDREVKRILALGDAAEPGDRALLRARYFQLALDPRALPDLKRMAALLGLPEPHPYAG